MTTPTQTWYSDAKVDALVQVLQAQLDGKANATDLANAITALLPATQKGAPNGLAPLDGSLKLPVANSPVGLTIPGDGTATVALGSTNFLTYVKSKIDSLLGAYIPLSSKGQISGVASLDGTGKVPTAQLPASGGGSSDFWSSSGYVNAGLTPSTQAQATASSNAIAVANTTALQNAVNNASQGSTIFIPAAPDGQAYYLASPVMAKTNIRILGGGAVMLSDASTTVNGGSCFKDIPGFTGNALFIIDNCYRFCLENIVATASTIKAIVLDNGNGSIFKTCYLVGGTEASYDSRNANQAPYNMSLVANQSGHRMNMEFCQLAGLSSAAGHYCAYFGVDSVVTGGRMNTGTKCLPGSGILMTGVHMTGGSPMVDCQDTRNTLTGCQLDGASATAMVKVAGSLTLNGCLFYNSVSSFSGGTPIPMILNSGSAGVRINGGLVSSDAGNPAYSYLTQYVGATANAVTSTVIRDLIGCSSTNFTTLWDSSGPPGKYSIYDGSAWHTDANTGTR
jgi:hypothetical protein